ncbi:MAG: hypothetical protein P4M12_04865 [Gammaproteobacteria bacterium]|nr:hypothetical protein [Gammaproteobacteria bacterium]
MQSNYSPVSVTELDHPPGQANTQANPSIPGAAVAPRVGAFSLFGGPRLGTALPVEAQAAAPVVANNANVPAAANVAVQDNDPSLSLFNAIRARNS